MYSCTRSVTDPGNNPRLYRSAKGCTDHGHLFSSLQKKNSVFFFFTSVPYLYFYVTCLLDARLRWRCARNISYIVMSMRGARSGRPVRPALGTAPAELSPTDNSWVISRRWSCWSWWSCPGLRPAQPEGPTARISVLSFLPEDGRRSSFRNVVFICYSDEG
jgi:hypothetical protein